MATTEARIGAVTREGSALDRILEADLTRPLAFAILAAVFLVVRLPYINYGHGTDPDAWRVAMTAHHLLDTGKYFPSRLPGNPLHELLMTVFIPGGWLATNLATALASLAGVYLFARIVNHLGLPYRALLVTGFAFTPLLYINSIATMDYMWTLTAILGAYYAALRGWPVWCGVCVGLAIGFRLQSFALFLPVGLLLWRLGPRKQIIPYAFASGGTTMLAFAPVLAVYGTKFLNFYDASVPYQDVIRLLGKEALGILGSLGVLAGAAISLSRLKNLPRDFARDAQVCFWVVLVGFYFASFFRLPHEIAYLIPVFPFGFLIMGRYFTRTAIMLAVGAILVAGVVDITTADDNVSLASVRTASIGEGLILSNGKTMQAQHDFVEEVLQAKVPDHSVVISGFVFPQLAVRDSHLQLKILERDYEAISMLSDRGEAVDEAHDIRYVWLLTYDAFEALRSQGYDFFIVPDAAGGTSALYYYRPQLMGASFLQLDQLAPSVGKGTAGTDR